jgi:formylglycine-generating enzyme required for sulfatase activity
MMAEMRRAALLWIAVLAGCYQPAATRCKATCASGDECPKGTSCADGWCNPPGVPASECRAGGDGGVGTSDGALAIDDAGHPVDDMIEVPAGPFAMGCAGPPDDQLCFADEPQHEVTVSTFELDRREVTQEAYALCVADGACAEPAPSSYWNPVTHPDWPAVEIDFAMAVAYCEWVGKRLPTEAEWEKAARGDQDVRVWPWGNTVPVCDLHAIYAPGDCTSDPAPVGSLPAGKGPYGHDDMAGNVWEWVYDWYDADYYNVSPASDPTGPATGVEKILRGGGFQSGEARFLRVSNRNNTAPDDTMARAPTHGVRCARSVR